MLSYQHGYHAGNYADVVKHLTLSRIIYYLIQKNKPLFYLETHAGRGLYDLKDGQALKTNEFANGIEPLWSVKKSLNPLFASYLDSLKTLNPTNTLRHYHGSPYLAVHLLRPIDRINLFEKHSREFAHLVHNLSYYPRVTCFHQDGLKAMQGLLPPLERRGLIFIDPSYEIKQDYKEVPLSVQSALKRFATGVYCIWYPITEPYLHAQYIRRLSAIDAQKTLRLEFTLDSTLVGMKGCGLWIINPPYKLAVEMRTVFTQLIKVLQPGTSSFLIEES